MSDYSVEIIIDDLNGLNEEAEQLIDEIEHMSIEEEKIDDISNEDRNHDGEYNYLQITSRENYATGLELS